MKRTLICVCLALQLISSDLRAQDQPTAATKTKQPSAEMQKLFNAFLGKWSITEKLEPSEMMPNGGSGQGEEVYRAGPGRVSIIEEIHLKETNGEISGMGVGWWDAKAGGYRALWCDSENPGGCILMARLAKWEDN